jgi:hypothetical protein
MFKIVAQTVAVLGAFILSLTYSMMSAFFLSKKTEHKEWRWK